MRPDWEFELWRDKTDWKFEAWKDKVGTATSLADIQSALNELFHCPDCGALILQDDTRLHYEFHQVVSKMESRVDDLRTDVEILENKMDLTNSDW